MKIPKRILIPILCLLLILAAVGAWILLPTRIHWNMTAYLVKADGTVESSFPFTADGKIEEKHDRKWFTIDYDVPREFRYSFTTPGGSGDPEVWIKDFTPPDPNDTLVWGTGDDREEDQIVECHYVYNLELGYLMITWKNSDHSYLVAATDPDVQVLDLIAHFQPYCEALGVTASE